MARIVESVAQPNGLKVIDGVIPRAKLLGNKSINGRDYSDPVIAEGIHKYDQVPVYLNHPRRTELNQDRDIRYWVGIVQKPRAESGGGFGDIKLRKEHRDYKAIVEACNEFPRSFGCSHVADIDSVKREGREIVNSIDEVFSVDLVMDPATTNGIFESRNHGMAKRTIKQILESTRARASKCGVFRKVIAEMVETGALPETTEAEVPETASDDESIKAGIMAAINTKLAVASADQLKKVLNSLEIGDSISALLAPGSEDATPPSDPPAEPKGETEAMKESREIKLELAKVKAESALLKSGRAATEVQINAVARALESERAALIESFPKVVTESGRGPRPKASPATGDDADKVSAAYESRFEARAKAAAEKIGR